MTATLASPTASCYCWLTNNGSRIRHKKRQLAHTHREAQAVFTGAKGQEEHVYQSPLVFLLQHTNLDEGDDDVSDECERQRSLMILDIVP